MKIAVLMSTYNGERFLEKQLKSLAGQTVIENMTVYVRDDASSDNTLEIIEKWKKIMDLKYVKGDIRGPAKSFWSLLHDDTIQADYYAFCDQDDIWDPDKLETAIKHLNENCLYACNCRIIDTCDKVIEAKRRLQPPCITIPNLFVSGVTQGCAMVFTNDLRKYICSKNIKTIPMHDNIVMLYALSYGNVYWDPTPHFSYRFHERNVVANKKRGASQAFKTVKRWKRNSQNSLADVAHELLENASSLSDSDKVYLRALSNYKKSFKDKFFALRYFNNADVNKSALQSYKIRLLANML